jgi:hypothetical protein
MAFRETGQRKYQAIASLITHCVWFDQFYQTQDNHYRRKCSEVQEECCNQVSPIVKQIVRLGGGSNTGGQSLSAAGGRHTLRSQNDIDLDSCVTLSAIAIEASNQLRAMYGCEMCNSVRRIEVPESIHIIKDNCFKRCSSLCEIIFARNGQLREIQGFQFCDSLRRIEFPESLEIIPEHGFLSCN